MTTPNTHALSDIRFVPAPPELRATGLRGWVSCEVDGAWRFDSMAVRRTRSGRYVLAFPTRRDRSGEEFAYYRPTGPTARKAIEDAVLGELRTRGFIT